jgi:hypothetical protein
MSDQGDTPPQGFPVQRDDTPPQGFPAVRGHTPARGYPVRPQRQAAPSPPPQPMYHAPPPQQPYYAPQPQPKPGISGFALWSNEGFIGFGSLGLIVAAVLFFAHAGPFAPGGAFSTEKCITLINGNELCGQQAKDWCNRTTGFRKGDPTLGLPADTESQKVCDDL